MPAEESPTEGTSKIATETAVREVASRELNVPADQIAVARLAGDASSRAFYRVAHPGGSAIAVWYPFEFNVGEAAAARFERWCASADGGRLTFANDPLCHVELTSTLSSHGVPLPAILAVADRDGMIFVEDAGDALLQTWMAEASGEEVESVYERAVDLLSSFRAATESLKRTNSVASMLALDAEKLAWELDFFVLNTFDRYLDAPLDGERGAAVREDCLALAGSLAARRRVLCHRDYHARNLIVGPGRPARDAVVVIDFQDARMGPVTYDLVSLLEDPYTRLDAPLKARLRERFAAALREEGLWPGDAALDEEYDLMTAQRLLKAVGTFTNQASVHGKRGYVPYIAPAATAARGALERLGRFPALLGALGPLVDASTASGTRSAESRTDGTP